MTVQTIDLPSLSPLSQGQALEASPRLAALAGVQTTLTVVAGHAHSTVGEILELKDGMLLQLSTPLNGAFDICLGTTVVARGQLVAVGEQFGIRVTEVAPGVGSE
ncbi:FliM/FliN family flagellar motor switch protein [Roseateles sp. DB2]|uniref:FliM/FliN family flagellar motor switch protein n=1 Tax=Roseateles sp. DB2 TaxID=3453717 RepID=UPI003EECBDF4